MRVISTTRGVAFLALMAVMPGASVAVPSVTLSGKDEAAQEHNHLAQEPFKTIIRGKDNPTSIADSVAYELFFRSLIFSPEESAVAESRYRALTGELAITPEEAGAIRAVAEDLSQRLAVLERRVAEIKDKHLPNLTSHDVAELIVLRGQKEKMINSFVMKLPANLNLELASKIRAHIDGRVKRKVTSVRAPVPEQHLNVIGKKKEKHVRFVRASYSSSQQRNGLGMSGLGHLYQDSWTDTYADRVWGRSTVTEDPNWYGHRWSIETKVYSPDGSRSGGERVEWVTAPGWSGGSVSISGDFGDFDIETVLKEQCPYAAIIFLGTFLGDPEPVPPQGPVGFVRAFLQSPSDPTAPESSAFASAPFFQNIVDFNIDTTQGPAACRGDSFIIQASFRPPPATDFCCTLERISLSRDNRFEISENPATGFRQGIFTDVVLRDPYVAVRLKKRTDGGGRTNTVNIHLRGRFGNGQSYPGQGQVKLICP